MKPLVFVTSNQSKAKEVESILGIPIEIRDMEIDEIQDLDVEKVVFFKAEKAFEKLQKPLIVEDAGLEVLAWNKFPGALIKHIHKSNGLEKINKWLSLEESNAITVVSAIGYHDGERVHTFRGEVSATFVEPRGDLGWGFDKFILPEGSNQTWGELGKDIKNTMSHRYQALQKLKSHLISLEK